MAAPAPPQPSGGAYGAPPSMHGPGHGHGPPPGAYGHPGGGVPVSAFGGRFGGPAPAFAGYRGTSGFKPWMAIVFAVPVVLFVFMTAIVAFVRAKQRTTLSSTGRTTGTSTLSTTSSSAPTGERITVDGWSEAPMVASANGDGSADVIVRYSVYETGKSRAYLGCFDGTTFRRLWRIGPLGELGTETTYTKVAVAGNRVLVVDSRANLAFYDVTNGTEKGRVKLTDRAKRIVVGPGGSEAFIEVNDKQDVVIDVKAGTSKTSPTLPKWMPAKLPFPDSFDCDIHFRNSWAKATCISRKQVPRVAGFEAQNGLVEGDFGVGLGKKTPGTGTPTLVGFDPDDKKVRWTVPLAADGLSIKEGAPRVADLVAGRVVVAYGPTSGNSKVAAFDAQSGKRLWENTTTTSADPLFTVTSDRVYVAMSPSLRVYDAKTGALVGTVGPTP